MRNVSLALSARAAPPSVSPTATASTDRDRTRIMEPPRSASPWARAQASLFCLGDPHHAKAAVASAEIRRYGAEVSNLGSENRRWVKRLGEKARRTPPTRL